MRVGHNICVSLFRINTLSLSLSLSLDLWPKLAYHGRSVRGAGEGEDEVQGTAEGGNEIRGTPA